MKYDPPIPEVLREACADLRLVGNYKLSIEDDWLQPYDDERVDPREINRDFDAATETKQGLLCGAIRICNTGCEGYHLYVYRGPHAGEIWSDQRVPFGRLGKISDSLDEYLDVLRELGDRHVTHWEKFR